MINYIALNIKYLCRADLLTQDQFGEFFNLKKGVIGSYIRGRTNPQIETIQRICNYFAISIDDFINIDIEKDVKKTDEGGEGEVLFIDPDESLTKLKNISPKEITLYIYRNKKLFKKCDFFNLYIENEVKDRVITQIRGIKNELKEKQ